ncbi:MAG: nucleotidyltransferase domain-containing protein [Betaproteobacteria bacterium]|nr:nucleotidyltransferase domain-containing protein [Betaproteobacteria bacterium]
MLPAARRRGRPAKPDALSPAERTRRYRERRRALGLKARVVWTPADVPPARGDYPSLDRLREARRRARERTARGAAIEVLRRLGSRGVRAGVFGSLAAGRFGLHSDVDFLVTDCPPALRYRIEADIEDRMQGIPFDVAYADEMREPWRARALAELRDASALR